MNIGIFDSGIGGLWILKYLEETVPGYNYIFFGDQAHVPYGLHTPDEITKFSFDIVDLLIKKDCKLVVVACNTATSAAIDKLRANYNIPFVGIEPAVKKASELSKTGHIGILATKVTAEGKKLQDSIEHITNDVKVHTCIGYGLVELVEEGKADTDEAEQLLRTYLEPLINQNIDELVLGCTHYAFLIKRIRKIVGDNVNIVDPAPAVVKQVKRLLEENNILPSINKKEPEILTSGSDLGKIKEFYKQIKI
jgi:glutamate racemase